MSKPNSRYIHAIFCDDVRTEIGGKLSLMGLYQGSMNLIAENLPVIVPKMCVVIEARAQSIHPFKKLTVRVLLEDKLLAEAVCPQENLLPASDGAEPTYLTNGFIFSIQPFVVEGSGTLKVRVDTEEGEIRAGGLQILVTPPGAAEVVAE